MIFLWIYLIVWVLWIFGAAVRGLYMHQETNDLMYENKSDVFMSVILFGVLFGVFWPLAAIVLLIMWAANRFLQKYKPRKES